MADTPEVFIGIDVSKAQLDIALHGQSRGWRVDNTDEGRRTLVGELQALHPTLIVLEATSGFELRLVAELCAALLPTVVTNPRRARNFARSTGTLAKTDRIDAGEPDGRGGILQTRHQRRPARERDHGKRSRVTGSQAQRRDPAGLAGLSTRADGCHLQHLVRHAHPPQGGGLGKTILCGCRPGSPPLPCPAGCLP